MNLFKQIVFVLVATVTFAMPGRGAAPEAEVKQVVEAFYKDYYQEFVKKNHDKDYDVVVIKWVDARPDTSPRFKKGLAKAIHDAHKKDPELGMDGDPIVAGQDEPKKGYRAKSVKIENGRAMVLMEGIGADAANFHISLEMVNVNGRWMIDRIADIPPKGK